MKLLPLFTMLAALSLAACGSNETPKAALEPLPAKLFVTAQPADPVGVVDLKKTAKEGDQVVIFGRIGGRVQPFTQDRAIMLVVDRKLPTCSEASPMEGCKTPWDYCCDDAKLLTDNLATVQIVKDDGQVLHANLENAGNMKFSSEVYVTGKVVKNADNTLIVNASSIYVKN